MILGASLRPLGWCDSVAAPPCLGCVAVQALVLAALLLWHHPTVTCCWTGACPAAGQSGSLGAWSCLNSRVCNQRSCRRHISGHTLLLRLTCEPLPSFIHTWLKAPCSCRKDLMCVYPGVSSSLYVPVSSPASV